MNTSLKALSLLLAAAIPATVFAEFLGVHLPAAFDAVHAFGAFVITLTLLTAFNDYMDSSQSRLIDRDSLQPEAGVAQFPQPAADTRLAA